MVLPEEGALYDVCPNHVEAFLTDGMRGVRAPVPTTKPKQRAPKGSRMSRLLDAALAGFPPTRHRALGAEVQLQDPTPSGLPFHIRFPSVGPRWLRSELSCGQVLPAVPAKMSPLDHEGGGGVAWCRLCGQYKEQVPTEARLRVWDSVVYPE